MPPITKQLLLLVCFFTFLAQAVKATAVLGPNNDECFTAFEVPVSYDPCNLQYVYGSNEGATDSSPLAGEPSERCRDSYEGGDVWYKVKYIPYPSNLLVKVEGGRGMDMVVEAYIGECNNELTPVGCADLEKQSFLLLTGLPERHTLYIRVWEKRNDVIGRFKVAVQWVPKDVDDLVLCDPEGGKYPANQFIVQFEEGASEQEIADLKEYLVFEWGSWPLKECDCGLEPMQLWQVGDPTVLDDVRKSSQQKSGVDTTEYNFFVDVGSPQDPQGKAEPAEPGYSPYNPDAQVRVAIIDSGVAPNHPDLQEALWHNADPGDDCVPKADIGYDFLNSTEVVEDIDGHGTGVNGVMILNYPSEIKLEIMNFKFFEGSGYLFDAVCAMHFAMNKEADMLNLSWGFYRENMPYVLERALWRAAYQDVLVVTSAGNDGEDNDAKPRWPSNADYENVLTVGAVEVFPSADTIYAYYSNYGKQTVDLAANGYFFTLAPPNSYTNLAGTSMSAPYVTRTASIMKATFPTLTAEQSRFCLIKSAKQLTNLNGLLQSEGMLDEAAAMDCAKKVAAPLSVLETSFRATVETDNSVTLRWQRKADANPVVFEVERSSNAKEWKFIGTRTSTAGQASYEFRDIKPEEGENFYRLRWKNETGVIQQSAIISVDIRSALQIFPNPVQDGELHIQLAETEQIERIELYDLSGKLVFGQQPSSANAVDMKLSQSLSGAYILYVTTPQTTLTRKLIIE